MTKNSEATMTDWRIVVMGVSGCGKSSVGLALAEALGARFIDGDDLHPEANKAKMAAGIPLNDDDRWPWLDLVGEALAESNTVVACSALKRVYRERILAAAPGTFFVHLHGTRELLAQRMNARPNHFMPVSLLDSQLNTLELLGADEPGLTYNIGEPIDQLVAAVLTDLKN
jgi:carbohydrate kinase (thermoresistant glucokinase family)